MSCSLWLPERLVFYFIVSFTGNHSTVAEEPDANGQHGLEPGTGAMEKWHASMRGA